MSRTIDVHNHLYPKEWMDFLEQRRESPRMVKTSPTSMVFYCEGVAVAHVDRAGHYDPEARIKDMDEAGIDTQMLSLTIPSVELIDADEGIIWARRVNNYFAEVCQKYPSRFYAYATLAYQDVGAAMKELDRAYKALGVKGITLFSNINGKPVSSPEFLPIYAKAEEYDLPIFIHPAVPLTMEIMNKHRIHVGLYGYTLDTTIAVVSLIWQGILEKYPKLKIIHSHLGGMVPYLVQRMDDCWRSFSEEMGLKLAKKPSEYYQSQVYPDSISYFLPAMRCCLDLVGPSHICLGTDYAHRIGNLENAIDWVRKLGLSEEDTDKILGGNAVRIFKLE